MDSPSRNINEEKSKPDTFQYDFGYVEPVSPAAPQKPKNEPPEKAPLRITRGQTAFIIVILVLLSAYFTSSAPDGITKKESEKQLAQISKNTAVSPAPAGTVKAYFNNGVLDETLACATVFPVVREVSAANPEAAFEELTRGVTANEGDAGFFTALSPGVRVQKVTTEENRMIVDFNAHLQGGVEAGSCRARAIRAQIEETAKQFPGVSTVVISVDGNEENVFEE
jgi:spore germination protein GerM